MRFSLFTIVLGYEDVRRKSVDGLNLIDSSRVNKSLYALLNVVNALNANENRVPYRESKLTRMLQDSFGGRNRALMLICLVQLSIFNFMTSSNWWNLFLIANVLNYFECRTRCFAKTPSTQQV